MLAPFLPFFLGRKEGFDKPKDTSEVFFYNKNYFDLRTARTELFFRTTAELMHVMLG